jgi:hypothetical protein
MDIGRMHAKEKKKEEGNLFIYARHMPDMQNDLAMKGTHGSTFACECFSTSSKQLQETTGWSYG